MFTGSSKYISGTPSNNTPDPNDTIRFTFWRYYGDIGITSDTGSTYWEPTSTGSGIKYGSLSIDSSDTGSIYTQNIQAKNTETNVNLYTDLTGDGTLNGRLLNIGTTDLVCKMFPSFILSNYLSIFDRREIGNSQYKQTQLYQDYKNFVINNLNENDTLNNNNAKILFNFNGANTLTLESNSTTINSNLIGTTASFSGQVNATEGLIVGVNGNGGKDLQVLQQAYFYQVGSPYTDYGRLLNVGSGTMRYHSYSPGNSSKHDFYSSPTGDEDDKVVSFETGAALTKVYNPFVFLEGESTPTSQIQQTKNNMIITNNTTSGLITFSTKDSGGNPATTLSIGSASVNFGLATGTNTINGSSTFNAQTYLKGDVDVGIAGTTTSGFLNLRYMSRFYDVSSPYTNFGSIFMNNKEFAIVPESIGDQFSVYIKNSGNTDTKRLEVSDSTTKITNALEVATINAPSATGTQSLYTNLIDNGTTKGTLNIGAYNTICQIYSNTKLRSAPRIYNGASDNSGQMFITDGTFKISNLCYEGVELGNRNIIFGITDTPVNTFTGNTINICTMTLNDTTFNNELKLTKNLSVSDAEVHLYRSSLYCDYNLQVNTKLSSPNLQPIVNTGTQSLYTNLTTGGSLTIGSNTSTCLIDSKTTFSQIPECSLPATTSNQLVNYTTLTGQSYTTLSAVQSNTNVWSETNTFSKIPECSLPATTGNQLVNYTTLTGQSYTTLSAVQSNPNVWSGTNTFNTSLPTSTVPPSSDTDLVTKKYVDDKITTTNQILNFSPTEVTSIKKSIIYRKATTITSSSIVAKLDNAPTIPQVYTFGKKIANLWLASSSKGNQLYYSTNGTTWQATTNNPFSSPDDTGVVNGLAWNGTIWLAVGKGNIGSLGDAQINYSYDGVNWDTSGSELTLSVFGPGGIGYGVAWDGKNMWVVVGYINSASNPYTTIAWSTNNGSRWSHISGTDPFGSSGAGYGVAYNGTMWVAVGKGTHTIAYSFNGTNWTGANFTLYNEGRGVAWNGAMWVAVGKGTGDDVCYSYDGIVWNGKGRQISGTAYGVAWNGKMWVVVGAGTNYIIYSYNGLNWTPANSPMFDGAHYPKSISWSGSMWFAVGLSKSGLSNIAYSIDGINWTSGTGVINDDDALTGIAFNSARPNTITFNNSETGSITPNNLSISLISGDQLDVVCDSYYNAGGFTNCSISIDN